MSVCSRVGPEAEQRAVRDLEADLASGRWAERNRELAELEQAELGLRLLVAGTQLAQTQAAPGAWGCAGGGWSERRLGVWWFLGGRGLLRLQGAGLRRRVL